MAVEKLNSSLLVYGREYFNVGDSKRVAWPTFMNNQ